MACGLLWHIALALSAQEGPITNLSCHPSNTTGIFNFFSHSLDVLRYVLKNTRCIIAFYLPYWYFFSHITSKDDRSYSGRANEISILSKLIPG